MPLATYQTEVFSCREFYRELSLGVVPAQGIIRKTLSISTPGIHFATEGSLFWIDGAFVDSYRLGNLLDSVRLGETPRPAISSSAHSINQRLIYISPEILVSSNETILAAFSITDEVVARALRSQTARCESCGLPVNRFATPLMLVQSLGQDWGGRVVTITAFSRSPGLSEWAAQAGFQISTDTASGEHYITLDSGTCSESFLTVISGLVRQLWRVPEVNYRCVAHTESTIYSRHGWCERCSRTNPPLLREEVRDLLLRGSMCKGQSTQKRPALHLSLTNQLTIQDLFLQPASALPTLPLESLESARAALMACGLGHLPLLAPTASFTSRDIAALCVAVSIWQCSRVPAPLLLDLPRGIFAGKSEQGIREQLEMIADSECVICVSDPFAETTMDYAAPSMAPCAIPSVSYSNKTTQVLGHDLGLLERLARLYAASLDARVAGLTAKDFSLGSPRSNRYICRRCKGLGVILESIPGIPRPTATPCHICGGQRFTDPVCSARFNGVSYQEILNRPIRDSIQVLGALTKASEILERVSRLGLDELPLGMPLALLSSSERHKLLTLHAPPQHA